MASGFYPVEITGIEAIYPLRSATASGAAGRDADGGEGTARRMAAQRTVTDLFPAMRRPLYHYLARILHDADEAEDLLQETFLRLFGELLEHDGIVNVRAWMFQVAHNLAIDRRRRTSLLDRLDREQWEQKAEPSPDPEQRLLHSARRQHISAAISSLSPRERRCIELRAGGLRYREIAELLGIGITSVENYYTRAVKKIAKLREGAPAVQ